MQYHGIRNVRNRASRAKKAVEDIKVITGKKTCAYPDVFIESAQFEKFRPFERHVVSSADHHGIALAANPFVMMPSES